MYNLGGHFKHEYLLSNQSINLVGLCSGMTEEVLLCPWGLIIATYEHTDRVAQ